MILTLGNPRPKGGTEASETTVQFNTDPGVPVSHSGSNGSTDMGRVVWLTDAERPFFTHLMELEDLWPRHAEGPPSFVKGDNPVLVGLVSKVFGCPIQE